MKRYVKAATMGADTNWVKVNDAKYTKTYLDGVKVVFTLEDMPKYRKSYPGATEWMALTYDADGHWEAMEHFSHLQEGMEYMDDKFGLMASTEVTGSPRYTLYGRGDDIIEESNNKAELIKKARSMTTPATVDDNKFKGIIFENAAQRKINNGIVESSTKVTASIDTEIISRAKEVVDYFSTHNRNLNGRQDAIVDELSDAVQSKSISGIRSAIEDLKYNSKNLNNNQYYLVIDLYDDFNLAGGKFNGMGRV